MSFSFYEVYITSLRALTAMGFPYGADEDAAYLITWLELHKLNGVKKLAQLSHRMNQKYQGKINPEDIKCKRFIDLKNASLLMKGPSLFDYFLEKTKKNRNLQIILENCLDPFVAIPLADNLSKDIELIHVCWLDNNKKKLINISKKRILIGEMKKNIELSKKQVFLNFSMNSSSKTNIKTKIDDKSIEYMIDQSSAQNRLKKSLNPNAKDWKLISTFANKTFVPATTESRIKGAGGGDDND